MTAGRFARAASSRGVLALALGAVVLRLCLFLGRGDYVAFDEGWYLLLGRNLVSGEGYTLNGTPHVALSPLFPALAGVTGRVLGDMVWGGRVVAAVTSGLLVLPCWSIFRRLAGRRTALLACVFVAVLPPLAPFVVPFWIGWDLRVGAEPVLHLFLYGGIALALRGLDENRGRDWALAGVLFALAYLARPEAILPFGLLGVVALVGAFRGGRPFASRALAAPVLLGVAFMVVAAPYWIYLRQATGGWHLTGRSVEIRTPSAGRATSAGPAATIERMLWDDGETEYLRDLYSLDASGLRLLSPYWGVQEAPPPETAPRAPLSSSGASAGPTVDGGGTAAAAAAEDAEPRAVGARYARALGALIPVYLLPFVLLGLAAPGRRSGREAVVAVPLFVTSLAIAVLVAADPRTQLFILPVVAYYGARGARWMGVALDRAARGRHLRRGFAGTILVATLVTLMLGTDVRRLYMSVTTGSPHHLLGSGKKVVGRALRTLVSEDEPVMSWHPAVAVYADRPWCVLPFSDAAGILRYARSVGCETLVVSAFHPAPWPIVETGFEYVIVELPPEGAGGRVLDGLEGYGRYALGRLSSGGP